MALIHGDTGNISQRKPAIFAEKVYSPEHLSSAISWQQYMLIVDFYWPFW